MSINGAVPACSLQPENGPIQPRPNQARPIQERLVDEPLKMPASAERAAKDISDVSVEGRPADAKAGPSMLRLEMLGMLAGIVLVSVGIGFWAGWGLGVAMLVVGTLALMFNPVLGATAYRAQDRKKAADQERTGGASPSKRGDVR
jgi:hypothetical protein